MEWNEPSGRSFLAHLIGRARLRNATAQSRDSRHTVLMRKAAEHNDLPSGETLGRLIESVFFVLLFADAAVCHFRKVEL